VVVEKQFEDAHMGQERNISAMRKTACIKITVFYAAYSLKSPKEI